MQNASICGLERKRWSIVHEAEDMVHPFFIVAYHPCVECSEERTGEMATILHAYVPKVAQKLVTALASDELVTLWGIKGELETMLIKLETVGSFLEDAERRRLQDDGVDVWLSMLKDVVYEAEDIIDLCLIEGERDAALLDRRLLVSVLSVWSRFALSTWLNCMPCVPGSDALRFGHEVGLRLRSANASLETIILDRAAHLESINLYDQISRLICLSPFSPESGLVGDGINRDTQELVRLLFQEDEQKYLAFAIVGMAGTGKKKSTLAKAILQDSRVQCHFETKIWLNASKIHSEFTILKCMTSGTNDGAPCYSQNQEELHYMLLSAISGRTVLIVIDDAWNGEMWGSLFSDLVHITGIKIRTLVTTANEHVAKEMGAVYIHHLSKLSAQDGWKLLCNVVSPNGSTEDMQSLEDIGMQIIKRCDCIPLAIKQIGGMLKEKMVSSRKEWQRVLDSSVWTMPVLAELEQEASEELRRALFLSYQDLPSHLKQCFLYLTLLPSYDTLRRNICTNFWISEGYVVEDELPMEDTAKSYFRELVNRKFLQPDPNNSDETECRLHSLLHSFAVTMSSKESFYGNTGQLHSVASRIPKLRRLSLICMEGAATISEAVTSHESLRTLLVISEPKLNRFDNGIFDRLGSLRVLDLSASSIEIIPDSIGSLKLLRHLDLHDTGIHELPVSFECLHSLQFLNLERCTNLHVLPPGITKLLNLKIFRLLGTPIQYFPKGMGRLVRLNYLHVFIVDANQEESSSLEELQTLSELRLLSVLHLEKANAVDNLVLKYRTGLLVLSLHCEPIVEINGETYLHSFKESKRIHDVFEDLCPPPSLTDLDIYGYYGLQQPSWLSLQALDSCLPNLTKLTLRCSCCKQLPALGQLPNLQHLKISYYLEVEEIGSELLGGPGAFRMLENLELEHMNKLETWQMEDEFTDEGTAGLTAFPRLKQLHVHECPKLKALPRALRHVNALTDYLCITDTCSLQAVEGFPAVKTLFLQNNYSLERVSNMPSVVTAMMFDCTSLKQVENLNALKVLILRDHSMECSPEWLTNISSASSLCLALDCKPELIDTFREGGTEWKKLQHISRIRTLRIDTKTRDFLHMGDLK